MQLRKGEQNLNRQLDNSFRKAGREVESTVGAWDCESMSQYQSSMNIREEITGWDECNVMQDQLNTLAKEIPKSPINLSLKPSPFFSFQERGVNLCDKETDIYGSERCETVISNNKPVWKETNRDYAITEPNSSRQQECHSSRVCSQIYDKENRHSGYINSFRSIQQKQSIFSSINQLSLKFLDSSKSLYNHTFLNRQRCKCDLHLTATQTCSTALKWIYKTYKPSELQNMKKQYESLLSMKDLYDPFKEQIDKDVLRTFTETGLFQESSPLARELKNVLYAFSVYDMQVGYVQGMNLIVAVMLYHAEEYIAFWLTCMIFESLEMRDIFLTDLPGIRKHVFLIDFLMAKHTPYLHSIFVLSISLIFFRIIFNSQAAQFFQNHKTSKQVDNDIQISDLFSSWILSLGAAFIPLNHMTQLIDSLLRDGWSYFYRLVLAYILFHEDKIIVLQQPEDVLVLLAGQSYSFERRKEQIQWDCILKSAEQIYFNENAITEILQQFDPEKPAFNITTTNQKFEELEQPDDTLSSQFRQKSPSFFESSSYQPVKSAFERTSERYSK